MVSQWRYRERRVDGRMKILHTADWHFGKTLDGRDRLPEQREFVDELCRICDDERVDLVLMAGDAYQSSNPSAQAEELFYDALYRLSADGTRAVVVIAGNHDSPERLPASAPLAERYGITLIGLPKDGILAGASADTSRVRRVDAGPSWLEVAAPGCLHTAVIAALPYPSEQRLNELLAASLDEEQLQQSYAARVGALLGELAGHFRADTVNLVMTHIYVHGGVESESEVQIQLGGAYAVGPDVFPSRAQYVALGHLHRPQAVAASPVVARYAGSPIAYSFSEADGQKSVVLVDVEPGCSALVRQIPLSCGIPLVRWRAFGGLHEVRRWVEEKRDARAWIDLEIHVEHELSPAEMQELRRLRDFVQVRPVVRGGLQEADTDFSLVGLSPEELFIRFYWRQKGSAPKAELVRMFSQLALQSASADGGGDSRAADGDTAGEEAAN